MRWAQGGTATLEVQFVSEDPVTDVTVLLLAPNGLEVDPGVPVEGEDGNWSVDWDVPVDAELGNWTAFWEGVSAGVELDGDEVFTVVQPGAVYLPDEVLALRNLVDRTIAGVDEFFTDDEIHTLYHRNDGNVEAGAAEGWMIKAAVYAEMVDFTEGGAERRLSQKFRNAMAMAKHFGDKVTTAHAERLGAVRTAAKVINLRKDVLDPLGVLSGGFQHGDAMFVRTYPLKRFPHILG